MYGATKEKFDAGYKDLRLLVLQKKITVERVKCWIKVTGQQVVESQATMRSKFARTPRYTEKLEKEDE